jgi:uncharacterized protein YkwD
VVGLAGLATACAALLAACVGAPPRTAAPPGRAPGASAQPGPAPEDPGGASSEASPASPVDPQARYGPEPVLALSPTEEAALEVARAQLGGGVRVSGALVRAARRLARRSAAGAKGVAELPALRAALAEGLCYDPAPTQLLFQGDPASLRPSLTALLARAGKANQVGVGAALANGLIHVVVLTAARRAHLEPFPRDVELGAAAILSGSLAPELRAARVYVTRPSGAVNEIAASGAGVGFRASPRFAERGRYLVEVVAQGPDGPVVAALLAVRAGGGPLGAPELSPPATAAEAAGDPEAQVLAAVNALRAHRGLGRLERTPALDAIARRHSEAMRRAGRIAHALPGSPSPGERVDGAGIAYQQVRENVARGESALAAHAAAVESPAHLENLLDPGISRVGVGVAQDASGAYLTELFVQPAAADDGFLTLDARVREVLWSERARRGLAPLTADPFLEEIARAGAVALRDADADPRRRPDLAAEALARRQLAAEDLYVATSPDEARRSSNLPDGRYRRVGVGVVQATSRRFGPGRLFIAVVYSD